MSIFMVTYDLITPGKKYDELYKALKAQNGWCHPVESVWFVGSSLDAMSLHKVLAKHLDGNDKLIVMRTSTNSAWSMSIGESARAWMRKHLWHPVSV